MTIKEYARQRAAMVPEVDAVIHRLLFQDDNADDLFEEANAFLLELSTPLNTKICQGCETVFYPKQEFENYCSMTCATNDIIFKHGSRSLDHAILKIAKTIDGK